MEHSQCKIAWDKLHLQTQFSQTVKAHSACDTLHGPKSLIRLVKTIQYSRDNVYGN